MEYYVIEDVFNDTTPVGDKVFWSNVYGWVAFDSADRFTSEERHQLTLPAGGRWAALETVQEQQELLQHAAEEEQGEPVYCVDVLLCATLYVRGASPEQAAERARQFVDWSGIEVSEGGPVSGLQLGDPNLPEVSLSPSMTVYGAADVLAYEQLPKSETITPDRLFVADE